MNKILRVCLTSLFLLSVLAATTACTSKQVCLTKAALSVAQIWKSHELSNDTIDVAVGCVDAFTQSPSSSGPQVQINHVSDDNTFSYQVTSDVIYNCAPYQVSGQYDYNVPFDMIVGTDQQTTDFQSLPVQNQTSDAALIANQLYNDDNIGQFFTSNGAPSGVYNLTAPPQSETRLTFSITIDYRYGIGQVIDTNGNAGETQVWLYNFSFEAPSSIPVNWQPVEPQYCQ